MGTRVAFAAVFAMCCVVIQLPILQLLGSLEGDDAARVWKLGLQGLVVSGTLLLPALLVWKSSRGVMNRPRSAMTTAAGIAVTHFLFWHLAGHLPGESGGGDPGCGRRWAGPPPHEPALPHRPPHPPPPRAGAAAGVPDLRAGEPATSLTQGVTRMGVIGTALLALLVGHGTVLAPYQLMGRFSRSVSDAQLGAMDAQLRQCLELSAQKKKKLAVIRARMRDREGRGGGGGGVLGWLGAAVGLGGDAGLSVEAQVCEGEIRAVERLKQEVVLEAVALREDRARARGKHTAAGALKNALGYLFATYCVFRLGAAFVSTVQRGSREGADPVAFAFGAAAWVVSGGRVTVDKGALRQVVTLGFIVGVLVNSLRAFVQQMLRGFSVLAGTADSSVVSLVFMQVMCFYTAASVLLILQRLPEGPRAAVEEGMGGEVEFSFFNRWFNGLFFSFSLLSILGLYLTHTGKRKAAREAQAFHVF